MRTKKGYYPKIIRAFFINDDLIIIFDNYEIRKIERALYLKSKDPFLHKIANDLNIWKKIKVEPFHIIWENLKIDGHPYIIGADSLYHDSLPFTEINNIMIRKLRLARKLSQAQLAKLLKVKPAEISFIETGKKTDLNLFTRILNALL